MKTIDLEISEILLLSCCIERYSENSNNPYFLSILKNIYYKITDTQLSDKYCYISTQQAAKILNVSEQRIRFMLKNEQIKGAKKINKTWLIPSTFQNSL